MRTSTVAVCSLAALAALDLSPKAPAPVQPDFTEATWLDLLRVTPIAQATEIAAIAPPEASPSTQLSDLKNHWAQPMIQALVADDIVHGFDDGTFRPDEPIAPQHLSVLVRRAIGRHGKEFLGAYADRALSNDPTQVMLALRSVGTPGGSWLGFSLSPVAPLTRAGAVALLHQALANVPRPIVQPLTATPLPTPTTELERCQIPVPSVAAAIAACDRLLTATPADSSLWSRRGNLQAKSGKLTDALQSYDRALKLAPTDAALWTRQGTVLSKLSQHSNANAAHDRALQLRPNYSLAGANRCAVLNKLGQYEAALQSCDRAMSGDGNWSEAGVAYAWDQRGIALAGLGKLNEAIAAADRAVALNPNYGEAWSNRSVTLWRLEQYEAALESVDRAVALKPTYSQGWFNKGRILRSLERYEAAIPAYDQALQGDVDLSDKPTLADIWANRSAVLWLMGKYPDALASVDRALKLDSNSALAWFNRGGILLSRNRPQEAMQSYDRALKLEPNSSDAWTGQGIALQQTGKYKEALSAFDQALAINSGQRLARINRAEVQQKLGLAASAQ